MLRLPSTKIITQLDTDPHHRDPTSPDNSDDPGDTPSLIDSVNLDELSQPERWQKRDIINNRNALSLKNMEKTTQDMPINIARNTQGLQEIQETLDKSLARFFFLNLEN